MAMDLKASLQFLWGVGGIYFFYMFYGLMQEKMYTLSALILDIRGPTVPKTLPKAGSP